MRNTLLRLAAAFMSPARLRSLAFLLIGFLTCRLIATELDPVELGRFDPGAELETLALSGHYAYLPVQGFVQVVDFAYPARLRRITQIPTGTPTGLTISVNYLLVANGSAGLKILDITDPS